MVLQSSGAISLDNIQTEFGGSNPIGINEYYGVAPGIPSSGTISFNHFYGTAAESWEIIMHTDGYKGAGSNQGNSTIFGNTGTSTFKNITWKSTGANNRTEIGDGVGLYTAFFHKKNITQFALISGSGGQNNLQTPSAHSSYHVWNTFTADRDGYTNTGGESLYEIINRLDTYNLNNSSWAGNDNYFATGASIRDFTAGTAGYSVSGSLAYPNPPTMKTLPLNNGSFSHTFTNAGATGRTGPTLTQIQNAYYSTGWASDTNKLNMSSQGIQLWTVPFTGSYEIEVAGAHGGGWPGGSGYSAFYGGDGGWVKGTASLTQGEVLAIIVGQQGENMLRPGGGAGGGGGSYVMRNSNYGVFYGVAGGGGGCNGPVHTTNPYGGDGGSSQGNGGDSSGGAAYNYQAGGGAGFNSSTGNGSGTGSGQNQTGGHRPAGGANGGNHISGGGATGYSVRYPADGGFGGGGAGSWHAAGGGGGWAGGDSADWNPPDGYGGTTYGAMSNQTFGTHTASHGYVKITRVFPTSVPDKFVIWGVNQDSDNDTQVLAAYSGNLSIGKGDSWRGNNPPDLYWSYWGNDWHSSSSGQTISAGKQTDPGIPAGISSPLHTGPVYLIAYGPSSVIPFSHTFTNAGATGRTGPTLTQIQNAYSSTSWASDTSKLNMTTQGYQIWTVPKTTVYKFTIRGARGGSTAYTSIGLGGYARYITGVISLTAGTKLILVVGQQGTHMVGNYSQNSESAGGGGGTWVVNENGGSHIPLLVAGGGGGGAAAGSTGYSSPHGNHVRSDNYSTYQNGNAYLNNGNGGGVYSSNYAGGGGGGWNSDGTSGSGGSGVYYDGKGGEGWASGLVGGMGANYSAGHTTTTGLGGFGGGGGAWINSEMRPGAGGGYSGGEGASYEQLGSNSNSGGGAGGNYINTTYVTSGTYGAQETSANHGSIEIEEVFHLFAFSSHTFTNAGATGRTGPTLTQVQNAYSAAWTNDTNYLDVNAGIQIWTVPATGTYRIEAWGAAGGEIASSRGQKSNGARMRGDFSLTKGEKIKILVGQQPPNGGVGSGGGGGSFVVKSPYNTTASILVIAGGGGGWYWDAGSGGSTGTSGNSSVISSNPPDYAMAGGTNGNGGSGSTGSQGGAGGGGFSGSGGVASGGYATHASAGGRAFTSGGAGGEEHATSSYNGVGGFGGGGASGYGSGGGGGYSGGGADWSNGLGTDLSSGGGGGSYNNGTNQDNAGNVQYGHGQVTITAI